MNRQQHYHRALRWYSPVWRAANGEAMVGDLMAQDDERGRQAPSVLDRFFLTFGGVRQRYPSGGFAVATGVAGLGLLLIAFNAFAPMSLWPALPLGLNLGWLLTWRPAAVLLGVGITGVLLTTSRPRRRAPLVTAAAFGLIAWLAGAFIAVRWPYLGPRLVGGSDPWKWLPLGWTITVQWIFVPALTLAGVTMLITALSAAVVGVASRRLSHKTAVGV